MLVKVGEKSSWEEVKSGGRWFKVGKSSIKIRKN